MGKGISLTVGVMCLVSIDKSTKVHAPMSAIVLRLTSHLYIVGKLNKSQSMWYPMMITIPLAAAINAISALAEIYFYLLHPLPTLSHRVIFFQFFLCFLEFWFFSYRIKLTPRHKISQRAWGSMCTFKAQYKCSIIVSSLDQDLLPQC